MSTSVLNCTRCGGLGEVPHWRNDGTKLPCDCCDGRGTFEAPDLEQLLCCYQRSQAPHSSQQAS